MEVLVEKTNQQDGEDESNQKMKFTFSKEDLMEVSIHKYKIIAKFIAQSEHSYQLLSPSLLHKLVSDAIFYL